MRFLAVVFAMMAMLAGVVRAEDPILAFGTFDPDTKAFFFENFGSAELHFKYVGQGTVPQSMSHKSNTQAVHAEKSLTDVGDPFTIGSWTQIHVAAAFGSNEVFDGLKIQKKVGSAWIDAEDNLYKAQYYGFYDINPSGFSSVAAIEAARDAIPSNLHQLNRDHTNGNKILKATNLGSQDDVIEAIYAGQIPWNWPQNPAVLVGEKRFTHFLVQLISLDDTFRGNIRLSVTTTGGNSCPLGSTCGDPQFVGLQGQSFQFHGMADEVFSLVSAPEMQINSLFKFISSGTCDYNDTMCWSHPGTYLGQIGIQFGNDKILLQSGAHSQGMKVFINDKETTPSKHIHQFGTNSNSSAIAQFRATNKFTFNSDKFFVTVHNSDYFFNMDFGLKDQQILAAGAKSMRVTGEICERESRMHKALLADTKTQIKGKLSAAYPAYPLHGLVGQTWRNAEFCGRYYEGTVDDYVVGSLFGNEHTFNYFSH